MRHVRLRATVLAAMVIVGAVGAFAADRSSDAASAEASEKTRQLLAYGIDAQVLDVVAGLRAARDAGYTPELTALLAGSRSPEVRTAVLRLFTDLAIRDGEPAARSILAEWETGNATVTAAAATYLAAVRAEGLAALLLPLVDSGDAVVAAAALRAIGGSRDAAAVEPLLARLASVAYPDERKGDLVVALGELGDARAVDALIRIAKGRDEDKIRRLYAADALGKIGDRRAVPVLKLMFEEDDALIRAYAASALAAFGMDEALPSLLAGLRDGNVKVRLQCTKALARRMDAAAAAQVVPIVRWKAENDPERAVRLESVRTLGEIADAPSTAFLEALLENQAAALEFREAALAALVVHAPTSPSIRAAVDREIAAKDPKPIEMMARVLSAAATPALAPVWIRLLDASAYTARIWALRGLAANGVVAALERIRAIAENDPVSAVRNEAARARERLATSPGAPSASAH